VRGDLADREALARLVVGAEAVLHVAGVVNTPDPMGFHLGNVTGTEALVEAAASAGVRRFVFVSSLAAREPQLSAYGKSKLHAEEVVAGERARLDDRPSAGHLRPARPRDPRHVSRRRLGRGADAAAGPDSIVHVEDLARLLLALPEAEGVSEAILEPDDGREGGWSHRELAMAIGEAVGRRVWAPHVPAPAMRAAAWLDRRLRGRAAKLTPTASAT
jgi:nucleoside-diphosphate-sugar epimerase